MSEKRLACRSIICVGILFTCTSNAFDKGGPNEILLDIREQERAARAEDFTVTLLADETTVKLGEPILVSLELLYTGTEPCMYYTSLSGCDDFIVRGADAAEVPYIGGYPSSFLGRLSLDSQETVCLEEGIELSHLYLFQAPGQYIVRFRGGGGGALAGNTYIPFPPSNELVLTVEPGEMPPIDKLIVQVLPLCPEGWYLYKSFRSETEVAPAHRRKVPGAYIHLRWFPTTGLNSDAGSVFLWQTDEIADMDWDDEAMERYPKGPAEYLGKGEFGHLYAYTMMNPKGAHKWEDPVATLKTLLIPRR